MDQLSDSNASGDLPVMSNDQKPSQEGLNIYRRQFVSICPADGDSIIYTLEIRSRAMVRVEHINVALALESKAFHEEIADRLFARFGGEQRMTAVHQGVEIETQRGFA